MRSEKPSAGTKLASGVPELNVVRASDLDDEASADIELPAELPSELSALASQLQSDAARLANRYPHSKKPASSAAPLRPSLITPQRLGAAVAMLLIGILGTWQFLPQQPAAKTPESVANIRHHRAERADLPTPQAVSPAVIHPTTYSIAELTSPELEALVDLMQRESRESSAIQRVSF
jgi:hypothetical protein